jgi:predicted transposase YbfD/YdcC
MKKIAVDGKVLRGSKDGKQKVVHLLSALMHDEKITVSQKRVSNKSNEITTFEPLLAKLPLEGAVVTADAMHCQISHVKFLVEKKKADFIFSVKENQGALLEWVKSICDFSIPIETSKLERKGHGRIEEYILQAFTPSVEQSAEQARFPYINQVISLTRSSENQTTKKATNETRHFITSLTPEQATSQDLLLTQVGHWSIEAGHYIRDEVMGEDRSRVRKGAGPQVMATLRNLSIGIIRKSGGTSIAESVRHFSWENKNQAIRAMGAKI